LQLLFNRRNHRWQVRHIGTMHLPYNVYHLHLCRLILLLQALFRSVYHHMIGKGMISPLAAFRAGGSDSCREEQPKIALLKQNTNMTGNVRSVVGKKLARVLDIKIPPIRYRCTRS
jgi:hypothetical protein